jgi:phosphate ABC transporter phosphate-binding protein
MSAFGTKWIAQFVCCCAIAGLSSPPSPAWQSAKAAAGKRLYVEPFTTKTPPEGLREDLIAELSKLSSVSLVSVESGADAILGGGGEIWIKGYRSLNPRSGRLPSHGTPVYGGYLSVELRNTRGETLWSYLATPETAGEDVSKNLAKRIAKHLEAALQQEEAPPRSASSPQPATVLKGAGATFPYPVYSKWLTNYRRENPNVDIAYDPVGSEAGIRRLLAGNVDFGASDNPQAIREISPADESQYLLFPSVVGAVVPIVNLPGLSSDFSFTPEALAGIYLGKITKWNDPILRQANKGIHLPDLDILVVHRADGSGTSYAWTDFLSKTVPGWNAQVGSGLAPKWPVGRAANGNEGVASLVKEMGGAIGYVEYIYALQHHLSFGKVRNRAGEFVAASLESIAAAVNHAAPMDADFKISIVNAPGAGAYPIASFTWLVIPAHIADQTKRNAIAGFLKWMLGPGQTQSAALGYLALPKDLAGREEAAIGGIH